MIDIKEYFEQANQRERIMLIALGIFLVSYLFYALIYSPLSSSVKQKQQLLSENKNTLHWMKEVRSQFDNVNHPESLSSEQILSVLSNQLKQSNFKRFEYQLEQTGDGDIQLSFEKVPYNDFVIWLWEFCGNHAVAIKQFNVDKKDAAGVVSIMVLLSGSSF